MSIKLSRNSTIYIACPANFVTGGPEAMHQLLHKLKSLGYNAKMYYFPKNIENPIPERFSEYNISFERSIIDKEENLLIVPEVSTEYLKTFKNIRKAIWWLSIDNFFDIVAKESKLSKLKRQIKGNYKFSFTDRDANNIYHLAQSYYAFDFLKKKHLNKVSILSDYLNKSYFVDANVEYKADQVLYNPKKGIEQTRLLMRLAPEIQWIALENMTLDQVKSALKASKVYIDFGKHPGKDRIPREAAINGCCVITGREGSANFNEDLPIPENFKFRKVDQEKDNILALIKRCFLEYEEMSDLFAPYRNQIKEEEARFEEEIKKVFIKDYF